MSPLTMVAGASPYATETELAAVAASAATLSELLTSMHTNASFSASGSIWVFTAPFPLKVVAASLVSVGAAVAANDTNYWSVALKKATDSVTSSVIATKTTQATGGAQMVQQADWNFDAVTFDPTNQVLAKGDSVSFLLTPTGAPTTLVGLLGTVRYVPS
jgi:hypothetical protein